MKVLFLSNIPSPYQVDFLSSLQLQVELLAYFLDSHGQNLTCETSKLGENFYIANFCHRISHYKNYKKKLLAFRPDIVVLTGYAQPLSGYNLYLCWRYGIPVVHWLERPLPHGLLNFIKLIYARIRLHTTSMVMAIGTQSDEFYGKVFHGPIINFPYSLNLKPYLKIKRFKTEGDKKTLRLLFSGQLISRKNVLRLVLAVKKINHHLPLIVTIIGCGELEAELKAISADDSHIDIKGFVQQENLPEIFEAHDVFILPSLHDGWGVVVTEAMAAAMPVIGTNKVGAIIDLIEHKRNGFVCGTDVESIQAGILYYLENPDMVNKHGDINRQLVDKSSLNCNYGAHILAHHLQKISGSKQKTTDK